MEHETAKRPQQIQIEAKKPLPWSPGEGLLGITRRFPALTISIFALLDFERSRMFQKAPLNYYQLVAVWVSWVSQDNPGYMASIRESLGMMDQDEVDFFLRDNAREQHVAQFIDTVAEYREILAHATRQSRAIKRDMITHLLSTGVTEVVRISNIVDVSGTTVRTVKREQKGVE